MIITKFSTKLITTKYLSIFFGDFLMTTSIVQTKQNHTELTQVRWTKEQLKALKKIAFDQDKKPAVYIRDFILEHHPEMKASPK